MSWTTPRTWVAGEVVTAAIGNTHWRDNLSFLHDPIATSSVSGANISFTSIPVDGRYTHLRIEWTLYNGSVTEQALEMYFNNDVTAGHYFYSINEVLNGAASISRVASASLIIVGVVGNSSSLYNGVIHIPYYAASGLAGSGKHAIGTYSGNAANQRIGQAGGGTTQTTAISQIDIVCAGATPLSGSASLYGIV